MNDSDVVAVLEALRALYNDKLPCVGACRIVQDADRLDKLGTLGIAAFFTKATLRSRGLIDALAQNGSRELTYALAAPRSMFTETGKKLAGAHAAKTVGYFDALLDDLANWGIASFERRTIVLKEDFRTRDGASIQSDGSDDRDAARLPGLRCVTRAVAYSRTWREVREAHGAVRMQ